MEQLRNSLDWVTDIDWKALDWNQLDLTNPNVVGDFEWKLGKTPFSHFQVPLVVGIFYLVSLYILHSYMKDKKPFVLKWVTLAHNIILTLMSTAMFLGAFQGAIIKYKSQGFWAGLVCEQDPQPIKGHLFFWSYIFYLSKFYELIDTYLLVLKKKPLIFLHVFHHFVMTFTCWAGLEGKWCMALWTSAFWNSFVHIFMYYYYSVSTLGIYPWWKKYLTALQIYQFVSGVFYTSFYFYYYLQDLSVDFSQFGKNGRYLPEISFKQGCTGELWAVFGMFAVNCSFLFLFSKFFVEQYLDNKKSRSQKKEQVSTKSIKNGEETNIQKQKSNEKKLN